MVLGQYRLPPHPPSEPAHSQLQLAELPRARAAVPASQAHHAVVQPEMPDVSLLGRAKQEAGRLRARTTDQTTAAAERLNAANTRQGSPTFGQAGNRYRGLR